jgi:DDE family transposase
LPFKLNHAGRHHISRQKHKVTNWPAYDAGLRQRGSLTVWFTDEAIQAWAAEPRTTRGGQPWYSRLAILTALTLRAVFRLDLRQTEGLIGSIIRLLGLDLPVPDHTTLSRKVGTLEVPLTGLGRSTDAERNAEPVHLLVDSTGLKLCGSGEWLVEKHGTKTRRSWRKLHLGVDASTGQIVASALTDQGGDDGSQLGPLLDQVAGPVASFTGDGAYDQKACAPVSPNAILWRPSSFRRARWRRQAGRPRVPLRSGTATSRSSLRGAEWLGRKPQVTTIAPGPSPLPGGGNGGSGTGCAATRMSAGPSR